MSGKIKILSFVKDRTVYRLLPGCGLEFYTSVIICAARYKFLPERLKDEVVGVQNAMSRGFVPHEIESGGRVYRVKSFKQKKIVDATEPK